MTMITSLYMFPLCLNSCPGIDAPVSAITCSVDRRRDEHLQPFLYVSHEKVPRGIFQVPQWVEGSSKIAAIMDIQAYIESSLFNIHIETSEAYRHP